MAPTPATTGARPLPRRSVRPRRPRPAALTALPGARIVDDDDRRVRSPAARAAGGRARRQERGGRATCGPSAPSPAAPAGAPVVPLMPTATADDWRQSRDGWRGPAGRRQLHGALRRGRPARLHAAPRQLANRRRPARRMARHKVVARFVAASTISAAPDAPRCPPTCTAPRTPPRGDGGNCVPALVGDTSPHRRHADGRRGSAIGSGRGWPPARPRPARDLRVGLGGVPPARPEIRARRPGAARRVPARGHAHLDRKGPPSRASPKCGGAAGPDGPAVAELDGTHFTIEGPVRRVEAMIAPAGSAGRAVLHAPVAGLQPLRPHLAADPG
jgi:hypothetical protein